MKSFAMKFLMLLSVLIFSYGCENEYPDSIYDADATFKANPIINSISPTTAFAAVDTIDIVGENFSTNSDEVLVFFNGSRGEIVSSSNELIRVISPDVTGDSITVQLSVKGALEFAIFDSYQLEPIMITYGNFDEFDNLFGLAVDTEENVFISKTGQNIQQITPDLERTEYAKLGSGRDIATQMVMGPEGYIYFVFGLEYLLRVLPDGGSDEFIAILPGAAFDLDFGPDGSLYTGGSGNGIYKTNITDFTSLTVMTYPDVSIKALRVFGNYIYVVGNYKGTDETIPEWGVWRNEIISGSETLGDSELFFDFSTSFEGYSILSMEIDENGDVYLGTTAEGGVIIVHPSGNYETLYPGILSPNVYALTWGTEDYLYMTRRYAVVQDGESKEAAEVLRLNMRKKGAQHYGRM